MKRPGHSVSEYFYELCRVIQKYELEIGNAKVWVLVKFILFNDRVSCVGTSSQYRCCLY
jgi:hypothetical protein